MVEAITMIAAAMPKDVLVKDLGAIVSALTAVQETATESDDPVREYLPAAWVRLCGILGTEFAPLLPRVLPPLLEKAAADPDVSFVDDEDLEDGTYDGWDFVSHNMLSVASALLYNIILLYFYIFKSATSF
jgi:importin-5